MMDLSQTSPGNVKKLSSHPTPHKTVDPIMLPVHVRRRIQGPQSPDPQAQCQGKM
jgi:hypothetical protein